MLDFEGENGRWRCVGIGNETSGQMLFYSVLEQPCPLDQRPQLAWFLTRANYGLNIGNFELDLGDGQVRYKTSVDIDGTTDSLSPDLFRNLVYPNVLTMDRYLPGIMQISFNANANPEEVIRDIEMKEK